MAIYLVHNAGDGTDNGAANTLNPTGTDWGKAEPTLAGAIALATVDGDIILVDADHAETQTVTAGTIGANISIIVVDKDASNVLATMGDTRGAWTNNNTAMTFITVGARKLYVYGLTVKLTGSSSRVFTCFVSNGAQVTTMNCMGWNANTNSSSVITLGAGSDQRYSYTGYNYTDRRDLIGHDWTGAGNVVLYGGGLSANSAAVIDVVHPGATDPGSSNFEFHSFDCSAASSTANLVGAGTAMNASVRFIACKLPTSYVVLATSSNTLADHEVFLNGCFTASQRDIFAYANGLGSVVTDDTIKVSAGAAGRSWKITTNANVSPLAPFRTPWLDYYNTVNTSISPYLEILRNNDSTSAYDDDEVWAEVGYKATSGSDALTYINDGMALLGSPTAQANSSLGAGDWAAESGSCWFGKLGVTLTAAEDGYMRVRVCVGIAITGKLHIDPQIRT